MRGMSRVIPGLWARGRHGAAVMVLATGTFAQPPGARPVEQGVGVWWTIPAAGAVAGVSGLLFGLPALRLHGPYLALGTFALAVAFVEVARSNAYYGAWALSTEAAELPFAAAASRAAASDAYYYCAKENIQTHGGMGFTWEVDCHLFFRRAKLLAVQAGAPAVWKEKLVKRLEQRNAA